MLHVERTSGPLTILVISVGWVQVGLKVSAVTPPRRRGISSSQDIPRRTDGRHYEEDSKDSTSGDTKPSL